MIIDNRKINITGKMIKTATVDDEWDRDIEDPSSLINGLKKSNLKADILTFAQRLPDANPKFNFYVEWDNVAAIPITNYENWLKKQISQEARNKIRKAAKKGVVVKVVDFNNEFIEGIKSIYDETPIKQGKPFYHYRKDLDTLKRIHETYLDRSVFIGSYYNDDLIGFIKLVFTDRFTRTMHVISKNQHRDKASINALIAKSVEICEQRKSPYLVYGKLIYGKKGADSLSNFKRENGFLQFGLPRYYIPLNIKGVLALKMHLHRGFVEILPEKLIHYLLDLRKKWYSRKFAMGTGSRSKKAEEETN